MQITQGGNLARTNVAETITALWAFAHANGISLDTIVERTLNAGVTIDGVLLKDGVISGGLSAAADELITGLWAFLGSPGIRTNSISEYLGGFGVVIDGLLCIDGGVRSVGAGSSSTPIQSARVPGEGVDAYEVQRHGRHEWGPGDAARDTNLYRSAPNVLKTDDNLEAAGVLGFVTNVITERTAGVGVTVDGLLIKDGSVPVGVVTEWEASLAILLGQITDGVDLTERNVAEFITALWSFAHASGLKTDVITERTADAGVTVDGLLIKDGSVPVGVVTEWEASLAILLAQITDGGNLTEDDVAEVITALWSFAHASGLKTDTITERTADAGVTIADVLVLSSDLELSDVAVAVNNPDNADVATGAVPVIRLTTTDSTPNVSGFAGGRAGRLMGVINTSNWPINLQHENISSAAANRLYLPNQTDYSLVKWHSITLWYNPGTSRWNALGAT